MNLLILASLYTAFVRPADDVKPWAYWLWENSHVDEKTIREDLADLKECRRRRAAFVFGGHPVPTGVDFCERDPVVLVDDEFGIGEI